MGRLRKPDLAPLVLLLILAAWVAVLASREAASRAAPPPVGPDPLWLRYLDAGLDPQDALWVRYAEEGRSCLAAGRFREAERAARAALRVAEAFPAGDPRHSTSEDLLARATARTPLASQR